MSFLPIVARELRVAARKRSTFWLRVVAASTGLVFGGAFLVISGFRGVGMAQIGNVLFYALTSLCLAAGLSAGLFFTSDALSEENREGTLGLLFLTDLRGFDVVTGKLLATSLRAVFGLLAVLPVIAITHLMGGVTGAQFWKTCLALVNALFCSLAAGLFVSVLSRDSQKALGATLFLLLFLTFGGPLADGLLAWGRKSSFKEHWSISSPGYVFTLAGAWGRTAYWYGLALTQAMAWLFFALACILAPLTWQEKRARPIVFEPAGAYRWKYGSTERRTKLRRKLLERDPILWLACRERWQMVATWALALVIASGFIAAQVMTVHWGVWMVWTWLGGFMMLLIYLWAASQACRLFVEGRRSGWIELLLAAPVTEKQIVRGQWRGLMRRFGVPVLLLVAVHVAGTVFSQQSWQRMAAQASAITAQAAAAQSSNSTTTVMSATVTTATVTISVAPGMVVATNSWTNSPPLTWGFGKGRRSWELAASLFAAVAAAVTTAANLVTLCWFGMWMGMTSRTANLATLKTILFVQVIPWFVILFGSQTVISMLLMPYLFRTSGAPPTQWIFWWPLLSTVFGTVLSLAKDIGLFVWARRKLYSSFREEAGRALGQPRFAAATPPPISLPPVIGAQI
jgi:ABC-type transport system involved in multi-copper enzyme maturation permease subunit